MSKGWYGIGML